MGRSALDNNIDGSKVRVVVIGGGVVGCSILYHLAKAGWQDVILLERDELTSGSSWHAAGSLYSLTSPSNASELQKYALDLYPRLQEESGQDCGFHKTGELWLACSAEEEKSLKVFRGLGRRQNIEAEFISIAEACEMAPILNPEGLRSVLFEPDAGHCDPSSVTHAFARAARQYGATIHRFTPVTGTIQRDDGSWDVITDKGTIQAEYVVNAAGLWAREVAALAGIFMPLLPVEHQYMVTEPIAQIQAMKTLLPAISFSEANVYMRPEGGGLLLGAYESNCVHWAEQGTPLDFGHELLPNDLERMEDNLAMAMERVPCLESTGIKRIINGPMIFSPDLGPLLGPHPALQNYFCATGVMTGFNQGPGIGKVLAQWIIEGEPDMDVSFWDVARFGPWADKTYTRARSKYWYEHRSDRIYPYQDYSAGRPLQTTPIFDLLEKEGAAFTEYNGWEDPAYFARNDEERTPRYSYERANWFEAVGEEALAVRDGVGLFEFSTFAKYRITGSAAPAWLDQLFANRIPTVIGKTALMPMLSPKGKVIGDFTLTRLADDEFLLVGAGGMNLIHMRWFTSHLPETGVNLQDMTSDYAGLHIAGPNARSVLEKITNEDVSNVNFPFLSGRKLQLGECPQAIALRVSFTGELGYELYFPSRFQREIFQSLREAESEYGLRLAGSHSLMSLRLEKSFSSWGLELSSDFYPDESGMSRFIAIDKGDFLGRDAVLEHQKDGPREKIGTFVVEASNADAFGGEPIYYQGALAGYVTSGGYGFRVEKSLALGYLSPEFYQPGEEFYVEILGDKRKATLIASPSYDPQGLRMKS
ncbi:MAG: dimethylglycine dehydrogenase [Lysobacterales bacterium]|jgi:dimethylglycine dehydrogenase